MAKRLKAAIQPSVLTWARTTAGYDLDAAAVKLSLAAEVLTAWEAGEDKPSIPQLRKLAGLYKRPLAVLYLPEPPLAFQPMHDFRGLPDYGPRRFSPGLTLEVRSAQQRRLLALELFEDTSAEPVHFALEAAEGQDPESVGLAIRAALGVSYEGQRKWGDHRTAFRQWRTRIEEHGVLVFQTTRIESDEASGFAFWAEVLPTVVVNGKDVYSRRIFSLLHELAHLMLRQSGVSEMDVDAPRPDADARIEVFCNQVAAAALMPGQLFTQEAIVAARGVGFHEWSDAEIESLSNVYGVSREAVVRRLLSIGRATQAFYGRKRTQYIAEFVALKARQKAEAEGKPIRRHMPRETVGNYGRPFIRAVLENYHRDRITLSEVSGYLGVKVKHIPAIEQQVGM
jgi:Zn-dependent peptidase ImmA (M78 family)